MTRLSQCVDDDIVLCSIVKAELWHGARKYTDQVGRLARLELIFGRHHFLPFDDAAWHYADIRHSLELAGSVIGPNDLKIAAICRAHGLVLVTGNTREFARVSGLKHEDWS